MGKTAIASLAFLIIIGGLVWLQIFLSRKNNKWFGLMIPIICFIFSIFVVLSLFMYTSYETSVTETIDGVVITENSGPIPSEKPNILSMLLTILPVFLISNISTLIFLVIYFASREKIRVKNQLDKMNIQDLE